MARFYFHLNNSTGFTLDREGQELTSRVDALGQAKIETQAVIAADVKEGRPIVMSSYIIVDDEYGVEVGRVGFADAISILG